jgi:hypothetical protein
LRMDRARNRCSSRCRSRSASAISASVAKATTGSPFVSWFSGSLSVMTLRSRREEGPTVHCAHDVHIACQQCKIRVKTDANAPSSAMPCPACSPTCKHSRQRGLSPPTEMSDAASLVGNNNLQTLTLSLVHEQSARMRCRSALAMPQFWKDSLCEPADVRDPAPGKALRRSRSAERGRFSTNRVDKSVRIRSGSALSGPPA